MSPPSRRYSTRGGRRWLVTSCGREAHSANDMDFEDDHREQLMPLSNAEVEAVIKVLWHTHAIRCRYEDRALDADERMWKNNGGMFTNFSRYNSQKWKDMMGEDDPTVRGRRISSAAMTQARREFEESYREPIRFALELVDKIRSAVVEAIEEDGPTDDGEYEEEVGMRAWQELASDPSVRKAAMEIAKNWCNVDPSSFRL